MAHVATHAVAHAAVDAAMDSSSPPAPLPPPPPLWWHAAINGGNATGACDTARSYARSHCPRVDVNCTSDGYEQCTTSSPDDTGDGVRLWWFWPLALVLAAPVLVCLKNCCRDCGKHRRSAQHSTHSSPLIQAELSVAPQERTGTAPQERTVPGPVPVGSVEVVPMWLMNGVVLYFGAGS